MIRDKTKPLQSIQTQAFIYSSTKTHKMLIINNCTNISFSRLFSLIVRIITPTF